MTTWFLWLLIATAQAASAPAPKFSAFETPVFFFGEVTFDFVKPQVEAPMGRAALRDCSTEISYFA